MSFRLVTEFVTFSIFLGIHLCGRCLWCFEDRKDCMCEDKPKSWAAATLMKYAEED